MVLFILFLVFKANTIILSKNPRFTDDFYHNAEELLNNDSSESSLIVSLLKISKSSEAKTLLGELYLLGNHVERNISLALSYFQKGYTEGSSEAGFYLYLLLHSKLSFNISELSLPSPTEKLLFSLYKTSLNNGSLLMRAYALLNYFRCSSEFFPAFMSKTDFPGVYCNHSAEQIAEFALELAENSITQIIKQGRSYVIPDPLGSKNEYGDNPEKLLKLVIKSLDRLDKKVLSIMAENYVFGNPSLGIIRNISKSIELYEKAANFGSSEAHENLAIIYTHGLGISKNYSKALDHMIEAINQGSMHSLNGLGYLYLNNFYLENSQEKNATRFFEYAAENGDSEGINNMGLIYIEEGYSYLGIEYLKLAAEAGYEPAQYNLGLLYMEGKLVKKNYNKAIKNFWNVIKSGHFSRFSRLGFLKGSQYKYFEAF